MDAKQVVETALSLADEGFDERVAELIRATDGDTAVMTDATALLQATARTAGTREHIAFTYLAAAFKQAAEDNKRKQQGVH